MGYANCVGDADGREKRDPTGEADDADEQVECTGDNKGGLSTIGEAGIVSIEDGTQRSDCRYTEPGVRVNRSGKDICTLSMRRTVPLTPS